MLLLLVVLLRLLQNETSHRETRLPIMIWNFTATCCIRILMCFVCWSPTSQSVNLEVEFAPTPCSANLTSADHFFRRGPLALRRSIRKHRSQWLRGTYSYSLPILGNVACVLAILLRGLEGLWSPCIGIGAPYPYSTCPCLCRCHPSSASGRRLDPSRADFRTTLKKKSRP